jgi:PilZ domain
MEYRRRVPRRSAGWFGVCHIEGESDPEWRDCKVADVSSLGLGITLHHFWPSELVGRQITVEAPAVGESVNVRFAGVITNADPTAGSVIRVGIEFDGLTELELAVAGVLSSLVDRDLVEPPPASHEDVAYLAIARPNA